MRCSACGSTLGEALPTCPSCGKDARFSVRAPDGGVYGPYTLHQVRLYALEGRIVPSAVLLSADGQVHSLQQAGIVALLPHTLQQPPAERSGLPGWAILLIVIGILVPVAAVVTAIWYPYRAMSRQSQGPYTSAQTATCESNLRQVSMALQMYRVDHSGRFPYEANWQPALSPYIAIQQLFA